MKIIDRLTTVLSLPAAYRTFQNMVGGNCSQHHLAEHAKPALGEKVLDIGCGPGDILKFLKDVNYTGFDISPEYIEAAKKRFGERGRFWCGDVGLATLEQERGTFDLALANGVLHHLDDERAAKLFELARLALRPDGRLVTFDGCYPDFRYWGWPKNIPEDFAGILTGQSAKVATTSGVNLAWGG